MTLFDSIEIYASEVEEIHTWEIFGLKEKFFIQWSSVVVTYPQKVFEVFEGIQYNH